MGVADEGGVEGGDYGEGSEVTAMGLDGFRVA